ncbi:ATP-binding protein [Synechococcus elongatus]|uniref:ATP-binding protein n=1 Tax=Synechococcus elongatus TaxID=32046 RepID=UPI0030D06CAB
MWIERHRRQLASGEQKEYHYLVDEEGNRSAIPSLDAFRYRQREKQRIIASLRAAESLLVVGEAGSGKSRLSRAVVEDLRAVGYTVVTLPQPLTQRQLLIQVAEQLEIEPEQRQTVALFAETLREELEHWPEPVFLVVDQVQRCPASFRLWLEQLLPLGIPMLLLATNPPAKDLFLKLPRLELEPLRDGQIRELMQAEAEQLGLELSAAELSSLQARCGGNPLLAGRVVREAFLGLDETAPDHRQWIDGTPIVICGLASLIVLRYIGLGYGNRSLYVIGGILTVVALIARFFIGRLPRGNARLGR